MTGGALVWIEEREILTLHDRLLAHHGGTAGPRDAASLHSALARAKQMAAYDDKADVIARVAAYTADIVQNHPFADGNKRTGFVAGILFLELNGFRFTAEEDSAAVAVIALAAGTLDQAGYTRFLRENVLRE